MVLNDLFSDSILDIAWSSNGSILMACSSDGSVACLQFDTEELGTPLSIEEKNQLYQRIYGKDISLDLTQANKDIIIENSEMLSEPKPQQPKQQVPGTPPKVTPTVTSVSQESPQRTFKQVETRTADGETISIPLKKYYKLYF